MTFYQEIINSAALDPSDTRCPKCNGDTLVLSGNVQMPQREVWETGNVVSTHNDPAQGGSFDVTRLDCLHCQRTYLLRDAELYQLERENGQLKDENHRLRLQIEELGGAPDAPPMPGVGYHH